MTKARSCLGKRRHTYKAAAIEAVWALIRQGLAYPGQMDAYHCAACLGWHLGHRPNARRGQRGRHRRR
jgi:hypothetical protein